jgi:hypothetical protein
VLGVVGALGLVGALGSPGVPVAAAEGGASPQHRHPQQQEDDAVRRAGEALREDPVFVDRAAELAPSAAEAERLSRQIESVDTPIFVAVLPADAGEPDRVMRRLIQATGLSGTYALVAGNSFRTASSELTNADELGTQAFREASSDGPVAVLSHFVDDVAAAAEEEGSGAGGEQGGGDGGAGDGDGGGSLVLLGLVAAGGVGLWTWSRRRRRREAAEQRMRNEADAEMIRAELSVLADDVLRLEPEVDLHPEARDDYEAAVERHRVASAALDYADEPVDLVRVERVVEEGRYAMARARATIAGREPPPPPESLQRPGSHAEPPLDVDERGVPVYAGGQPFYGGGGWYGAGGGLFGGLLLGSMLGGWGWGGPVIVQDGGGDGGDGGGEGGGDGGFGGLGGGDWGGDLGGGDWGDMGGGDW